VIAIAIFAIALLSFVAFLNRVSEEMVSVVSDTLRDCKSIEQEFGPLEAVRVKLLNRKVKALGETSHHLFSIEAKYATEAIDMRVELKGQTGVWRLEKLEPRSGSPRFASLLSECLLSNEAAQQ
jgi:type II secretory pathway component PulJ